MQLTYELLHKVPAEVDRNFCSSGFRSGVLFYRQQHMTVTATVTNSFTAMCVGNKAHL